MNRFFYALAAFFCLFLSFSGPTHAQEQAPKFIKDIPYIEGTTDQKQMLDLYIPATGGKSLPVLVFVHGGGWGLGDKKMASKMGAFYTQRGAIVVSLNYRLAPKSKYPDFAQDLAAAMRWVNDHIEEYGGNRKNMVLSGHSAGAHLAALIGTHPGLLKDQGLRLNMFRAVMPVDTASFDLTVDPYGPVVRRQIKMRERAFGSSPETLADASPTVHARKASGGDLSHFDIFVTSKRADAIEQSRALEKAVEKSGSSAQTIVVPDLSHLAMCYAIWDEDSVVTQTIMKRLGI